MKTILNNKLLVGLWIVLLCLRSVRTFSQAGWYWQNPLPQGNPLYAVSFVDANTGTAVGNVGTILRTTDGGETWSIQVSGTTCLLSGIFAFDANIATAVGDSGTILRTTNGGATWTTQVSGTTSYLNDVSFTNVNNGTVVGYDGTILRTTNGGTSWTTQASGTTNYLGGVFFTDVNTGTVVGVEGTILRTTNAGATWVRQLSPATVLDELISVYFSDSYTGTVAGYGGIILRTTNAGITWITQSSGTRNRLYGISLSDANTGTVVGEHGTILRTTTGGVVSTVERERHRPHIPIAISLEQNYPNPFNPATTISFSVPSKSFVSLKVFDALGREVSSLVSEELPAGTYARRWNAAALPSGVYFYRLQAGDFVETKKLVLLR